MTEADHKHLDKVKVYCPKCFKECTRESNGYYMYDCHCWGELKYPYTLRWCDACNKWTKRRGGLPITKCYGCQSREQARVYGSNLIPLARSAAGAETRRKNGIKCLQKHWAAAEWKMLYLKKMKDAGGIWCEKKFCEKCGSVQQFMYGKYCRSHDKEHCGNVDLFLQKKIIEAEDGRILYMQGDGILVDWEEYKRKFVAEQNCDILDDIPGASIVSTFREQGSDDWAGARIAFERSLVDMGLEYFAYVKFYIGHDGSVKPLVAGKTGSKLANIKGSDLDFGDWNGQDVDDSNNTTARHLLFEDGLHWDKTKILIVPCDSEDEALSMEKYLQDTYNLFKS